jgi:hypothetical protein
MPTVRNIADIKSNLLRPALTSHFEVEIGLPVGNNFPTFLRDNEVPYGSSDQIQLRLMCSEATLPGSNLATFDINDNFHGVTERHAYRRIYDDRIDLTFYVDAENYLPIRFFETWMKYIVDESRSRGDKGVGSEDPNYFYRVRYPEGTGGYTSNGLKVIKFERDYKQKLEYNFIKSFPISITSMPISYDSSSLLKCTVSMTYIRYVLIQGSNKAETPPQPNLNLTPEQLARINSIPFNSNLDLGVAPLTTGGVPTSAANASGNTIDRRVEAGLPYVGRNRGPTARFAGI